MLVLAEQHTLSMHTPFMQVIGQSYVPTHPSENVPQSEALQAAFVFGVQHVLPTHTPFEHATGHV